MRTTPSFIGLHVTVLHREDGNTDKVVRQLRLLGMRATVHWAAINPGNLPDIIMVDADGGWDDLLPFETCVAPRPVVALLASEAPGRVAWAISKGAGAIIPKPVASSAVYPALVMAVNLHEERREARDRIQHLEERVRLRPLVHRAIERLMAAQGVGEDQAYRALRECAMRRRLPMEQVAAFILSGLEPLPEAI